MAFCTMYGWPAGRVGAEGRGGAVGLRGRKVLGGGGSGGRETAGEMLGARESERELAALDPAGCLLPVTTGSLLAGAASASDRLAAYVVKNIRFSLLYGNPDNILSAGD